MTSEPLRALSDDEQVLAAVADLGRQLLARKPEVLREITTRLSGEIEPLEGAQDRQLHELLDKSIEGNLDAIFFALINDVPLTRVQPATAAVEYAVRLAQRGIPAHSLMRAYPRPLRGRGARRGVLRAGCGGGVGAGPRPGSDSAVGAWRARADGGRRCRMPGAAAYAADLPAGG